VTNTGKREGADVPQLYLTEAAGDKRMRLLGFERIELKPGETRRFTIEAEPRLGCALRRQGRQVEHRRRNTSGRGREVCGRSVLTRDAPLSARQFGT
jgi:beta-glucosidase